MTITLRPARPTATVNPGGLTTREHQILTLIARGDTNQQIAADLYLSINSVKTFIRSGYRRIGVTSRTEAIIWALAHEGDASSAATE